MHTWLQAGSLPGCFSRHSSTSEDKREHNNPVLSSGHLSSQSHQLWLSLYLGYLNVCESQLPDFGGNPWKQRWNASTFETSFLWEHFYTSTVKHVWNTLPCIHACKHTHTKAHTHSCTHTKAHTHSCTHSHAHIQSCTNTKAHTHLCTHTKVTHTHAHTH